MASGDAIAIKALADLEKSPYACTSLVRLSGGSANFTYRGTLATPLHEGTSSIIIKHAEPFVAANSSFKLDVIRSYYEQTMLTALNSLQSAVHSNMHVTTPQLYEYSSSTDTQVLEDYPSSLELKNYMTTHSIAEADVARLGIALGSWLKKFHAWGAEQTMLREIMKKNRGMKQLKFWVNYGRLVATIELFPTILEECRSVFVEMEESYKKEAAEEEGELIHGDFWSGNFLLHDGPIPSESEPLKLVVIDWELSQLSSRAFDLGQCFAELFLLKHFRSIQAGSDMISAFMAGYGSLDEHMAFRVALHFGVHLIVWPCRVPGWGEGEAMERCVEFGRDCCKHAWKKDTEWFRGGVLEKLFFPS